MLWAWLRLDREVWRDAAEMVLSEISNSVKPLKLYASVFLAWLDMDFFEPNNLDELPNCIPPTSHRRRGMILGWESVYGEPEVYVKFVTNEDPCGRNIHKVV